MHIFVTTTQDQTGVFVPVFTLLTNLKQYPKQLNIFKWKL